MIQDADEDLVIQAKKAKNSASEKLKELKRKFEIKAAGTKAEIAVIKKINEENDTICSQLDMQIKDLSIENSKLQNAKGDLERQETIGGESLKNLESLMSENDAISSEIADNKAAIIQLSKRVRTTAAELSELNIDRENLIQDNSALKQERFNNEVKFKTKERHLIQTKKRNRRTRENAQHFQRSFFTDFLDK